VIPSAEVVASGALPRTKYDDVLPLQDRYGAGTMEAHLRSREDTYLPTLAGKAGTFFRRSGIQIPGRSRSMVLLAAKINT
jgi:hypothetical protein